MPYVESREVENSEINQTLHRWTSGHAEAGERMVSLVYCDLHRMAESFGSEHRGVHQVTDWVKEAYLQLFGAKTKRWQNRRDFLIDAARVMRHVLVNYCKRLQKDQFKDCDRASLAEVTPANSRFGLEVAPIRPHHLLALDEMIRGLECVDIEMARVAELRFFAGLSLDGTADCLEMSREAVDRLWCQARAWLQAESDSYGPDFVHSRRIH